MEAILPGVNRKEAPAVVTREVEGSFTMFSVDEGGNHLKAYINPTEYVPFAEGLLRAAMEFLRLAREQAERGVNPCPIPPDS